MARKRLWTPGVNLCFLLSLNFGMIYLLTWRVTVWFRVPCLIFGVLAAILLIRNAIKWRAESVRRQTGCCLACGYDLRASKDRCPECGTPIPSSGKTTA